MITDISPFIIYEMASLKGERIKLCRYQYKDMGFNEGVVIVSDIYSFFIRIKSNVIEEKHNVNFLIIKAFQNIEIDDTFTFEPIFEGTLRDIQILKSTVRGMVVRKKIIQDIVTESALLADFEEDKRFMIHPGKELFTDTGVSFGTDKVLDKMSEHRYSLSRKVERDINLLLCEQ